MGKELTGYEKIKNLILEIDEYTNEYELREYLQIILFECEEHIIKKKNPITTTTPNCNKVLDFSKTHK